MKRKHRLSVAVLGVALIVVLLLLVAGLRHVEVAPGRSLAGLPGNTETAETESNAGTASSATQVAFRILLTVATVLLTVGAVFFRRMRYTVYIALVIIILFVALESVLNRDHGFVPESAAPAGELGGTLAAIPLADEEEAPGLQTALLIALGISALVVGGAIRLWIILVPLRRRRRTRSDGDELGELMESVDAAATRICAGDDPRTVVLLCYKEMVEILSRRGRIVHHHLTPREFADVLLDVGMAGPFVSQLTEVFELVRYGNRTGRSLADRAITLLEGIQATHLPAAT